MAKRKTGLHKEISSIFDGVPRPDKNGSQQSPREPIADRPSAKPTSPLSALQGGQGLTKQPPQTPQDRPTPTPQEQPARTEPKPRPKMPRPAAAKPAMPKQPGIIDNLTASLQKLWQQSKGKFAGAAKSEKYDTRQKVMMVLIPILFIILIIKFKPILMPPPPPEVEPDVIIKAKTVEADTFAEGEIPWRIPKPYPTTLRDPMQFGSKSTKTVSGDATVKGIVFSEDNPSVVIGTQILHEGDVVSGATIIKINKDSVEFDRKGERFIRKVNEKGPADMEKNNSEQDI